MSDAAWIVDAGNRLRAMARYYTDDTNDAHLLAHYGVIWLMLEGREQPLNADLAAALCASARGLSAERRTLPSRYASAQLVAEHAAVV